MKIREMQLSRFREVIDYDYLVKETILEKGIVSLIQIKKVIQPVMINNQINEYVAMIDQGYEWMQIAYESKKYWIHVFYNEQHEIVQIYIDLVTNIDFSNRNNPIMEDAYLDVIIDHNQYTILDKDEFEQAYLNHDLNEKQYQEVKDNLENLCNDLDWHMEDFLNHIEEEYFNFVYRV